MVKKTFVALLVAGLVPALVSAQDAKSALAAASKAMGADTVTSIEYSGTGAEYSFGQAVNAGAPWPAWDVQSYKRAMNFETPAWRLDRVLAPVSPQRKGGGLPPGPNQTVIVAANTPWPQQLELWMAPHGFLRAAAARNATAASQTVGGKKMTVVTFVGDNKAKVTGYINADNMLERVESAIDNAMLGDTPVELLYSDYKDFSGVKFPAHIIQKQGGYPTLDLRVTDVKPNGAAAIQAPQGRGGAPGGGAPPAPATSSQKLADGIWVIFGGYAAVAVDFKDYVVVIEGPQSEPRAAAIIEETKKLIPNKPIRYVVNTHHHFDHSSGLRTFVAEGATILTHESNKGYFEKIFALPHALSPDKLATANKKVNVELMGDKKVLTDGNQVLELYRLQNSSHNDGLIVAYFPKHKILVEADAFNPPAQADAPVPPANPNNTNLVENLDRLKLDVDVIIPVHYPPDNRVVTKADLMKIVGGSK